MTDFSEIKSIVIINFEEAHVVIKHIKGHAHSKYENLFFLVPAQKTTGPGSQGPHWTSVFFAN